MTFTHAFHPTVLREYDIRGIVGETLSPADATAVGKVFGTLVKRSGGKRVCVGYDGRVSSPAMEAALVEGLRSVGVEVERVGRGPTPMLYFATVERGADGGIMVTGSHNPPTHNGFKMMLNKKPFFGADIKKLGEMAGRGDVDEAQGTVKDTPVFDDYINRLLKDFKGARELTAVWDPGNGAGGEAVTALVKKLPGKHIVLNGAIDGTFPAHHPDPTVPKNLEQLIAEVAKQKADVGFAFDGDADRIGVVDGKGRILWGDQILQVLAEDVLQDSPGAPIIADVKASQALFDEIGRMGGKPLMWKTGHSLIKNKMAETKAPLAGEMSGHIFFADKYYGFDDAVYAAVRFLSIMARDEKFDLAKRYDAMPVMVNTPELRFPCDDTRKFAVVDEVKARLQKSGANVSDIDGVRVNVNGGWWLLRASNTQAVLVARAEAASDSALEKLKAELAGQLQASGLELPAESVGH
ncbi:MAG: phosphomannomutase/phosphoglucomutase [Proteobacteria bacterium]|nr:phosphomannomutase/phosphoglucomutase [Pseudomonadota bacterium]